MAPAITLAAEAPKLSAANTGFMLICSALVLIMTPGLAFFYGGMVRVKSVLNMLMMSFIAIGIVSIIWVFYGFSVAFDQTGNGFMGGFGQLGLNDAMHTLSTVNGSTYNIPVLAFSMFQLMFAVITPALISGAIADRAKFLGWSVFVTLWTTIVYFPVA